METLEIGPLRTRVLRSEAACERVLVLMHGFGAPGDDLVGLASMLEAPAGTTFVFPEAPHLLAQLMGMPQFGDARAWWLIDMAAVEHAMRTGKVRDLSNDVPEGLADAREKANAMLDALPTALPDSAGKPLYLGGFSQGAMLATDILVRADRPIAGLVLLSGTLLAASEWVPLLNRRAGTRVFQSHGTDDAILSYAIAAKLKGELERAGLAVTFESFRGPHTIPPAVLRSLSKWLT